MLEIYTVDGFENIQYKDCYALAAIEERMRHLFTRYGYHPVMTPTFESYDLYAEEKSIPSDDLFKLVNRHGHVLALRPDATLPITRMAALNHHDAQEILKFFYQTNIYRNFASPAIVKKELTQMGVEYFGNSAPECDGEVIGLAILSLLENGIQDVHIDLGHVGFINCLMDELKLPASQRSRLLALIENKNIGDIGEYLDSLKIGGSMKEIVLKLPKLYGDPGTVFEKMRPLCVNREMEEVVDTLKAIYRHLDAVGLAKYLSFDLGFTNQMNYYSDIIFKGYIDDWGEPVLSGGRYDHLSEKFGISRPACGFALDMIKMMEYMENNGLLPEPTLCRAVLIYTPEKKAESFRIASALRAAGQVAEMYVQTYRHPEEQMEKLQKSPLAQPNQTAYYYIGRDGAYRYNKTGLSAVKNILEEEAERR